MVTAQGIPVVMGALVHPTNLPFPHFCSGRKAHGTHRRATPGPVWRSRSEWSKGTMWWPWEWTLQTRHCQEYNWHRAQLLCSEIQNFIYTDVTVLLGLLLADDWEWQEYEGRLIPGRRGTPLIGNPGLRALSDSLVKPPLDFRSIYNTANQCTLPLLFTQGQICMGFYHHPSST